ncbi:LysR family transcriptional regulator [Enterobacterales bacterium CwR94]|nr:LysR family transcriptional regulator [Enterobacterales bacterium CwR94]
MELHQLRCFITVAEELHFGHAAQRLNMLPSALGRHVRLLEEDLGTRLLSRSTRNVALTSAGSRLLTEARELVAQADALSARFRLAQREQAQTLRIGAIDSAAVGLLPTLLAAFRERYPQVAVQISEEKTLRLLPKLKSGRLDMVLIRPPERPEPGCEMQMLLREEIVVALPASHPLADREELTMDALRDMPMIVPERRSRPHSYDLTMDLFAHAGMPVRVSQVADEKQTIVNLVAAGLGLAIVPRWTSRIAVAGVTYLPLREGRDPALRGLPLAAAWLSDCRDPLRDAMLALLTGMGNRGEF